MTAYAEERNIRMTAWRIVVLLCLYSSIAAEVSAQQNSKSIDMRNRRGANRGGPRAGRGDCFRQS